MAAFTLETSDMLPIVAAAVEMVRPLVESDRLAYSEREAEIALGLGKDALGDERRNGNIKWTFVRNQVRYTRQQLLDWMKEHEMTGAVPNGKAQSLVVPRLERASETRRPGSKLVGRVANKDREAASRILRPGKAG